VTQSAHNACICLQSGADGRVNWGAVHPREFYNPQVGYSSYIKARKDLVLEQPYKVGYNEISVTNKKKVKQSRYTPWRRLGGEKV
jgi:hypothetical protein